MLGTCCEENLAALSSRVEILCGLDRQLRSICEGQAPRGRKRDPAARFAGCVDFLGDGDTSGIGCEFEGVGFHILIQCDIPGADAEVSGHGKPAVFERCVDRGEIRKGFDIELERPAIIAVGGFAKECSGILELSLAGTDSEQSGMAARSCSRGGQNAGVI